MDLPKGWLKHNIERAAREVESWPLHRQEMHSEKPFTLQERHDKTKLRIRRLHEEIAREEENLKKYAGELGNSAEPEQGGKFLL